MLSLKSNQYENFKKIIWDFYAQQARPFVWRYVDDPYHVLVSEVMLQQTQTHRVAQKYPEFIKQFPNFEALAQASLREVLFFWQGLGYNRRGKYLHETAKLVVNNYQGDLPACPDTLNQLPGIGKATAASICAFAFNMPTVFIETNIRAVFIHFFFLNHDKVPDRELIPLIEQTLDQANPREWYYALMDFGVYLKKNSVNPSRRSAHYITQSKFEGSDRQIRGMILKLLTQRSVAHMDELFLSIDREPERIKKIVTRLCDEQLLYTKIVDNKIVYYIQ